VFGNKIKSKRSTASQTRIPRVANSLTCHTVHYSICNAVRPLEQNNQQKHTEISVITTLRSARLMSLHVTGCYITADCVLIPFHIRTTLTPP